MQKGETKLCEILMKLRQDRDLTQKQLSQLIGIDETMLASYETGNSEPPISILVKFALFFNVSTDYLLGVQPISKRKPPNINMNTFQGRLKFLRWEKDVTQDDVAIALGTCKQVISNIEIGRNEPSIKRLVELADYFNVSLDWLLCRTDKRAEGEAAE